MTVLKTGFFGKPDQVPTYGAMYECGSNVASWRWVASRVAAYRVRYISVRTAVLL